MSKELSIFELQEGKEYTLLKTHYKYKKDGHKIWFIRNINWGWELEEEFAYLNGYTEVQPEPKLKRWYLKTYLKDKKLEYYLDDKEPFDFEGILINTLTLEAPESASAQEVYEMFKKMESEEPDYHNHCEDCSAVRNSDCESWQRYNQEACDDFVKKMEAEG